jgi:hypothetical protein
MRVLRVGIASLVASLAVVALVVLATSNDHSAGESPLGGLFGAAAQAAIGVQHVSIIGVAGHGGASCRSGLVMVDVRATQPWASDPVCVTSGSRLVIRLLGSRSGAAQWVGPAVLEPGSHGALRQTAWSRSGASLVTRFDAKSFGLAVIRLPRAVPCSSVALGCRSDHRDVLLHVFVFPATQALGHESDSVSIRATRYVFTK